MGGLTITSFLSKSEYKSGFGVVGGCSVTELVKLVEFKGCGVQPVVGKVQDGKFGLVVAGFKVMGSEKIIENINYVENYTAH